MKVEGIHRRSVEREGRGIRILDQTRLPWDVVWLTLTDENQVAHAIRAMQARGAPLIGAVAAYGLAMAVARDPASLEPAAVMLAQSRPTAINLAWALERMLARLRNIPLAARAEAGFAEADAIADEDAAMNASLGAHGLPLLAEIAARKGRVNVLTHCNAGWLATVDYGTALSPIYQAHDAGLDVHVWVDETRPRNQGGLLTAFELGAHGVPHRLIADNAGGHLMQHGEVDLVLVGADRVTRQGDVANKIGTYLKALAAYDNGVPFWVALPSSTIDWRVADGVAEIPIEERAEAEMTEVTGRTRGGAIETVRVTPPGTGAANPAFDVTPARLVSGLITERGRCAASEGGLRGLFPQA
jgi:methylthioribose-1-phosphate isomerase